MCFKKYILSLTIYSQFFLKKSVLVVLKTENKIIGRMRREIYFTKMFYLISCNFSGICVIKRGLKTKRCIDIKL
jgi:hypothetical protein